MEEEAFDTPAELRLGSLASLDNLQVANRHCFALAAGVKQAQHHAAIQRAATCKACHRLSSVLFMQK